MRSGFGDKILRFYASLRIGGSLPEGVAVMNPYREAEAFRLTASFLKKFFSDSGKRVLVFGINPGRFGGGATGVSFTDPIALEKFCGIKNGLPKKRELSSVFIYDVIAKFGGPKKFFKRFFLTAVCPLGFTEHGKNYNFYDDPGLYRKLKPFIVKAIRAQIACGASAETAVILGTGKIAAVFNELNDEYGFFKRVMAVEHPRFIMQYRRKKAPAFVKKYLAVLARAR